jgi:hypothetical protein
LINYAKDKILKQVPFKSETFNEVNHTSADVIRQLLGSEASKYINKIKSA